MGYISITEYAEKYGLDRSNVHKLVKAGRVPAIQIGRQWCIEEDAPAPEDRRVKSGAYRNWRKKATEQHPGTE